jgi:hypothetical protein
MEFTTMDRIFNKVNRDLQGISTSDNDIIEWTGEALAAIQTPRYLEEAVAFLEVKNWTVELPSTFSNIIQIAKNTRKDTFSDAIVSEDDDSLTTITNPLEDTPDIPVMIDCNGVPYTDYELAYYRPYNDLSYTYFDWSNNAMYKRCYVPVRLAEASFFNSVVCSENGTDCGVDDLYYRHRYEYKIIRGNILKLNFEKGLIALSYLRPIIDAAGRPMIPDTYSATTAITKYITLKLMERLFYLGKEGSNLKVQKAEIDWNKYVKMAKSEGMMPQTIDEYENLLDQKEYLIPRRNVYENYFSNLGVREIPNKINYFNNYYK